MNKVYYNLSGMACVAVIFAVGLLSPKMFLAKARIPYQQRSLETSALESHEGLTITARPWLDAALYKEKFPKKSPYAAGILALQVVFRNDSNESMKIALDKIRLSFHLDDDTRQEVPALTGEEVAEETLKPGGKDPTKRSKIPMPVSIPKSSKDKQFNELRQQAELAGVPANVLAPHSSVQGMLFFDLQGQFDLVNNAHLYVPDIQVMGTDRSLTYFEIDLSRQAR